MLMARTAQAVRGLEGDHATLLRAHLVETTERLLEEAAPASLTTRRIARAARVSDGVLYNHFADKDALVLAAMTRRFSASLERFRASLPEAGSNSVPENMERIAEAALELHVELVPIVGALLSDDALLRRFLLEIHREEVGAAEIAEVVDRYLAAERALGRVGNVDTRAAVDLLVGGVAVRAFAAALGATASCDGLVATLVAGLEHRA
jgi:AcrR family transcriptional regulator